MSTNNSTSATLGRSTPSVRAIQGVPGDCVPDNTMDEIARRILISIQEGSNGIIRSEVAPTDTSKIWYQPSSQKLLVFDTETDSWVEVNADDIYVCVAATPGNFIRRDDSGCLYAKISASEDNLLSLDELGDPILDKLKMKPVEYQLQTVSTGGTGAATLALVLSEFEDAEAVVTINFKVDPGANSRWWITSQTINTINISFAGYANSVNYSVNVGIHRKTF